MLFKIRDPLTNQIFQVVAIKPEELGCELDNSKVLIYDGKWKWVFLGLYKLVE